MTLDEKFDAVRISTSKNRGSVLKGRGANVSGAKAEQYVQELLKDSKNRLGLSALSTNDPNKILEVPGAILKVCDEMFSHPHIGVGTDGLLQDTQYFNVASTYIPVEPIYASLGQSCH